MLNLKQNGRIQYAPTKTTHVNSRGVLNTPTRNIIIILFLFVNFLFAVEVKSFRMTTNNTNISAGDVVQVFAELALSGNASVDIPQFPQSENYTVLGANKSQSSSTSISMVNGKTTTDKTITIRFSYQIQFNSQKTVNLPPLLLTIDGKQTASNGITFNIGEQAPEESKPVSVKFIRNRSTIYKGEQATLTIRVLVRANSGAQLTNDGYIGFLNNVQEKLSEKFNATPLSNSPQTKQEVVNGVPHFIYDLPFNLVPTDTGKVTIPAMPILYVVEDRSEGRDPFDGFFGFSSVRQKQASVSSPALKYTINSLPKPMPKNFTGIIGEVKLTGNLSKDSLAAGESATLKVTMSGKMPPNLMGEIELGKNPDLDIFPPERKVTTDTAANGLNTKKQYSWMIVPKREGEFSISVPEVVWFDPSSATYKTAKAGNFMIKASAGEGGEKVQARRYLTQSEIATLGDDIRYIKTAFAENDIKEKFSRKTLWQIFIAIWILALILVLIKLKLVLFPKNANEEKRSKAFSSAVKELNKIAVGKEKSASEISAILKYISAKTGKECGSMKYDEIEKVLNERKVKKETCENLTKYFREVEVSRYAANNSHENLAKNGIEILKQIEREFK